MWYITIIRALHFLSRTVGTITEFLNEPVDDGVVGSYGNFFKIGLLVIDPDFGCFGKFHGLPPWAKRFMILGMVPKVSL